MQAFIRSCAVELFGDKFEFRKGQLEAIESIVSNVVHNVKQTVLEAPTGSGKSVIGMIAAYVLWKKHGKKSYILTSDLSLYAQYENDIKHLNVNCFGCIKGKENYICNDNGCKVSQATCSLQGLSVKALLKNPKFSYRFRCVHSCQYIKDYAKAVFSPITLMTYQFYFIQRNYVEDGIMFGKNKNFPERDLVICDECHNICSICQTHFAPAIDIKKPYWMETLDNYTHMPKRDYERMAIVDSVMSSKSNNELLDNVAKYASFISHYCSMNESIRARLSSKKRKLSKFDKAALLAGNTARQVHCKFDDMLNFVTNDNIEYFVKTQTNDTVTINYVFDDAMLERYFHSKSRCELLMSATVGDFNEYAKLAGLDQKTFKSISIPSTFDFTESPIYFTVKNKMSYAEKDRSILSIAKEVDEICKDNANCKGIIQTGSYANSEVLKDILSEDVIRRCLFYKGAEEKNSMIKLFMNDYDGMSNHILVGPTLLEGLNFPNDMCRFQICIKIPYAHLGNEYVRKKKDLVDGWYKYDVLNKICQGIGRGIRHDKDWCKTYILDGCVQYLLEDLDKMNTLHDRFIKVNV